MYYREKLMVAAVGAASNLLKKPKPICCEGESAVDALPGILLDLKVDRVLVVTGPTLTRLGVPKPIIEAIEAVGIKVSIFNAIGEEPTYQTVRDCADVCRERGCQAIAAIGGGSVLDVAKAVAVCKEGDPESLTGLLKVQGKALPLIAVPTTAGTGSEATMGAVISTDGSHRKTMIIDPKLVPLYAILDPSLSLRMPPQLTAQTALDALTHALEAYISEFSTPETRAWSIAATRLILNNLEGVCKNPWDIAGRQALLKASYYGGLAISRAYVGYVHAFAHSIGGKLAIPHGLACGVILPKMMTFYLRPCEDQLSTLATRLGPNCDIISQEPPALALVRELYRINKAVGIPQRLDAFHTDMVEDVIDEAFAECHGSYPVPAYMTRNQARQMLVRCCGDYKR